MQWLAGIELAGGLLGIVGSIVLAYPAVVDLANRRLWDQLRKLEAIQGAKPKDVEALKALILDDVLGGYRLHVRCAYWGCIFLVLGFAVIAFGGGVRMALG